jgi:hypothetical protein
MEFLSIYDLIQEGISHGSIATAIEKQGEIYGWDRFGRYRKFKSQDSNDEHVFKEVFDSLAADFAWLTKPMPEEEREPRNVAFGEFPRLAGYGWPLTEKIDFSTFENTANSVPARPKLSMRADNSSLRIIGALRQCLVGDDRDDFLKQCPKLNDAQLIVFLVQRYKGFEPFSDRSLQKKFAEAKRLLESS